MQVRHSDLLILRLMDQLELITDENNRTRLSQTMMTISDKASSAERSQLWVRTIMKRHAQTLRNNLERYYVLRIVQQSLFALYEITDLHQDIIYQHQFLNGKIISFPKYRIVVPMTTIEELLTTMPSNTFSDITTNSTPAVIPSQFTTQTTSPTAKEQNVTTSSEETTEGMTTTISTSTQPDIDWEQVNELDEQEVEKDTGLSIPILSIIVGALIAISSTIVYGVYQLCIPSNTTVYSNVTSVMS